MLPMSRIDPQRVATILEDASWFDRLDLTSPKADERQRAALMLATTIVTGLDMPQSDDDPRQLILPSL
jgi:hypothetical protein